MRVCELLGEERPRRVRGGVDVELRVEEPGLQTTLCEATRLEVKPAKRFRKQVGPYKPWRFHVRIRDALLHMRKLAETILLQDFASALLHGTSPGLPLRRPSGEDVKRSL